MIRVLHCNANFLPIYSCQTTLSNSSQCDGTPLELPQLEGIAIVNIPSVYGGANLWGDTDKKKSKKVRGKGGSRENDLAWAVQGKYNLFFPCLHILGLIVLYECLRCW